MTVLLQDRMIVQKKKKITVTTRLFINHVLQRKEKLYHFKLLQDLKKVTIFLFILLNWFIKTFNSIVRSYD